MRAIDENPMKERNCGGSRVTARIMPHTNRVVGIDRPFNTANYM